MQTFHLSQPASLDAALAAAREHGVKFIAGGTDLMQLLKDNIESPTELIDLEHVDLSSIQADAQELRLGAMARMSDVAAHPDVRAGWPIDCSGAGGVRVSAGAEHGHNRWQPAAANTMRLLP